MTRARVLLERLSTPAPGLRRSRAAGQGRPDSAHGFTILELLIVVTLIFTLTAIGMVQLRDAMRRYRLQSSASMVAGKVTEARLNALKRNRATWLQLDPGNGLVQVQANGTGGGIDNIGNPGRLAQGVTFAGDVTALVTFDTLGRLPSTRNIALVDTSGTTRTVAVAVTGSVSVN